MPYSRQHNLIFVHIPKNAGTSVESSLGLYNKDANGKSIISEEMLFGNSMQHYTIGEIIKHLVGRGVDIDVSRSFAVIRDPAERFISHYKWTPTGAKSGRGLEEFFYFKYLPTLGDNDVESRHRWPQHIFISSGNKILVEYLLNFKKIDEAFVILMKLLEIIPAPRIGHHKKSQEASSTTLVPDVITDFIEQFYRYDYTIINKAISSAKIINTNEITTEVRGELKEIGNFNIRKSAIDAISSNRDREFRKRALFALSCLELKMNHFTCGSKYYLKFIYTMPGIRLITIAILMYPLIALSKIYRPSHNYLINKLIKLA